MSKIPKYVLILNIFMKIKKSEDVFFYKLEDASFNLKYTNL